MRKYLTMACLLLSLEAAAQAEQYEVSDADYNNTTVDMADVMRSNGKIYVVVGAVFIVFAGITFYLIRIDRKVSALEREVKQL